MRTLVVDLSLAVIALASLWAMVGIYLAEAAMGVLAAMDEHEGRRPATQRERWRFRGQSAVQWWLHPAVCIRALSFGAARAKGQGRRVTTSDEADAAMRDFAESERQR